VHDEPSRVSVVAVLWASGVGVSMRRVVPSGRVSRSGALFNAGTDRSHTIT